MDQSDIILDLMMFPYIFPRFRKDDLINMYGLMSFPDVVILENQSVGSGEEVCFRGLFELVT